MAHGYEIEAGERAQVFRRRFSSLPLAVTLQARPLEDGDHLAGTVERIGSRWIFGRTRRTVPLAPEVVVIKGYWDTFFEIAVTADVDVAIRVDAPAMRARAVVWGLAALVLLAAIAVAATAIFG